MWKSDAGLGAVNVHPDASATDVPAALIGIDAKSCKKAFASGSLPAEVEGQVAITRLFTRCGTDVDAFLSSYFVVPRNAGGVYVIGLFGSGDSQGQTALDPGFRKAVVRALPK
jgi:hypothetical protein